LEEEAETSGQYDLIFIGDEVPKDEESDTEDSKNLAAKAVKQIWHRKKDVGNIRLFGKKITLWDTNMPSGCQSQC
jgi:hypothetical protein